MDRNPHTLHRQWPNWFCYWDHFTWASQTARASDKFLKAQCNQISKVNWSLQRLRRNHRHEKRVELLQFWVGPFFRSIKQKHAHCSYYHREEAQAPLYKHHLLWLLEEFKYYHSAIPYWRLLLEVDGSIRGKFITRRLLYCGASQLYRPEYEGPSFYKKYRWCCYAIHVQ